MVYKTCESVDTNIILRLILKDVPEQCLSIQDLLMRMGVAYHVSDLAITETVYTLQKAYGWKRVGIVDALGAILEMSWFKYNEVLFEKVFSLYLVHPKLSFNDCYLAVEAEMNGAEPLWTFDKKLVNQVESCRFCE